MKPADIIKKQHRAVEAIFKDIERGGRRDKLELLVATLGRALMLHMTLEEELVYPTGRDVLSEPDLVIEAQEEHHVAKLQLLRLLDTPPDHEAFHARLKVLKDLIMHHVKEEERKLLPRLSRELDRQDEQILTRSMIDLEKRLLERDPLREIGGEPRPRRKNGSKRRNRLNA
jgi:hemerythrin superfamily protein